MFRLFVIISLVQVVPCESSCPKCRASDRCEEKYQMVEGHTACLVDNPAAKPVELSTKDKQDIVDYHNEKRASIEPKPANMLVMYWDDELEMLAKRWANQCRRNVNGSLVHDDLKSIPGSTPVGQNIGKGHSSFKQVMDAWLSEKWYYDMMIKRNFTSLALVGHYTQFVWAESNLIGCAAAFCPDGLTHVCNYAPPGNVVPFLYPYIFAKSEAGENCPKSKTEKGLCDCKTTICRNWGTIDVNNCTCKCNVGGTRNDCGFYCEDDDPSYCGKAGNTDCNYGYTQYTCPHYCGSCPCAGRNYISKSCETFESNSTENPTSINDGATESNTFQTSQDANGFAQSVKSSYMMYLTHMLAILVVFYF